MSYAAIYDVTRALRILLHSRFDALGLPAVVTLLPPGDSLPEASGVNLYLYRVMESPFTRNQSWPGDRATPPSDEPALGLQLSYLLTPLGTNLEERTYVPAGDDSHTMLGVAMLTLHEHPVLNDVHIPGFDADTVLPSYLLDSYDKIRVSLTTTSLEELSKIWATINQPYRLSVAYEVSLVELSPTAPPPTRGGIVTATGVTVVTLDAPRLAGLVPAQGPLARVSGTVTPNTLQIQGFGFGFPGQTPIVRVGGQVVDITGPIPPVGPGLQSLTVNLPTSVDAGPDVDVRVTLNRRTSQPLTFTVGPWLASLTPIRTALDPARGPADLKLILSGSGFTTTPQSVRFDAPVGSATATGFDAGGSDAQATIAIPMSLANGLYDVRIVVDGAGNASNARTLEVLPRVDRPIGVAVVTPSGSPVHQLTVDGARLDGGDVRLIVDDAVYQAGANVNANQIVYTFGRLFGTGAHQIAVDVDGHTSRAVDFEV